MSDELLNTMSTRGKVSITDFRSILNELLPMFPEELPDTSGFQSLQRDTLRFLQALGHCEVDWNTQQVFVCPPALVLLPKPGLPEAALTGARSPRLLSKLKNRVEQNGSDARLVCKHRGSRFLPVSVYLQATGRDVLQEIAKDAGIEVLLDHPAAWAILDFSFGIREIESNLQFEVRQELGWQKRFFSPDELLFVDEPYKQGELELVEYLNPVTKQFYHHVWQNGEAAEIDRNWGRFLILKGNNISVLFYDIRTFNLALPAWVPPPVLIDKALVLCSGMAPKMIRSQGTSPAGFPTGCRAYIYPEVPPKIAELASEKLGQRTLTVDLPMKGAGVSR